MAHELSNTLTFMLPTFQEVGSLHQDLLTLLSGDEERHSAMIDEPRRFGRLAIEARVTPEDLLRMNRQLQLSESRLRRFHQDLRLGCAAPQPDQAGEVALHLLVQAMASSPLLLSPPAKAPVLEIATPPATFVHGDPALLSEALARMLRAALGWARTVGPQQRVCLSLVPLPGDLSRLSALIPGDPARLPAPEHLLQMLCPSESGAQRAERGPLGIVIGAHLFRVHGGELLAQRQAEGVALFCDLPRLPVGTGPDR